MTVLIVKNVERNSKKLHAFCAHCMNSFRSLNVTNSLLEVVPVLVSSAQFSGRHWNKFECESDHFSFKHIKRY